MEERRAKKQDVTEKKKNSGKIEAGSSKAALSYKKLPRL
jgi:hypothetical protein